VVADLDGELDHRCIAAVAAEFEELCEQLSVMGGQGRPGANRENNFTQQLGLLESEFALCTLAAEEDELVLAVVIPAPAGCLGIAHAAALGTGQRVVVVGHGRVRVAMSLGEWR